MTFAHTTSRTFPNCDNSLDSLTLPAAATGDFVKLILIYDFTHVFDHSEFRILEVITYFVQRNASSAPLYQPHATEGSFSSIASIRTGRPMNCGLNPCMDKSYKFCRFLPDSRIQTSYFSVCTEGHLTGS